MIRGSRGSRFGNELQLFGAVQVAGFSAPRMRRFMPAGTWLVAPPVWIATHGHGCARRPQRRLREPGHAVPVFLPYVGAHPVASSSLRLLWAGSQSSDWFWLPPTTRSATIGIAHGRRVPEVARDADAHDHVVRAARLHGAAALDGVGPLRAVLRDLRDLDRARAGVRGREGALHRAERALALVAAAGAAVVATGAALGCERADRLRPVHGHATGPAPAASGSVVGEFHTSGGRVVGRGVTVVPADGGGDLRADAVTGQPRRSRHAR